MSAQKFESTQTKVLHVFEAAWLTNPSHVLSTEDVMWLIPIFFGSSTAVVEGLLCEMCMGRYLTRHVGGYRLHPGRDPLRAISPGALLRVALDNGWREVAAPRKDGLHVLNSPAEGTPYRQLIFPFEPYEDPDLWAENVRTNLEKLSTIHNRPVWSLVREVLG